MYNIKLIQQLFFELWEKKTTNLNGLFAFGTGNTLARNINFVTAP
jgi:hypothetical protein